MKSFPSTLAKKHPVIAFLLINFAWTWLFWLAAVPFRDRNDLLVMALVMIGGYGPAISGILALGLRNGMSIDLSKKKVATLLAATLIIFTVMALRYTAGNISGYDVLAEDLSLRIPIAAAALAASLVGGWVISSSVSSNPEVRARMKSILPRQLPVGWTLLAVFFFPAMIIIAWGLASLLGLGVEYPGLWGRPVLEVLPLYTLTFCLTALVLGGMEEPGWRGLMQPALQNRYSPLAAALVVAFFWSLWHLPLYLNGFYPGDLLGGMLGGFIYRILLAIFLAWFYNRSGGNLFLMIILHTSFNVMVNFLPTSDLGLLILWVLVAGFVVIRDKMYQNRLPEGSRSYTGQVDSAVGV